MIYSQQYQRFHDFDIECKKTKQPDEHLYKFYNRIFSQCVIFYHRAVRKKSMSSIYVCVSVCMTKNSD